MNKRKIGYICPHCKKYQRIEFDEHNKVFRCESCGKTNTDPVNN